MYPILYADDTNVFLTGNDMNVMISTMNVELEKLLLWLQINKLKLNVNKTHYMTFGSKRKKLLLLAINYIWI